MAQEPLRAEDIERRAFMLLSAARSALEVAGEALRMSDERKAEVVVVEGPGLVIDGLRMEQNHDGLLSRRGVIGAQAFLSNLVVVENCIVRLSRTKGLNPDLVAKAEAAALAVRQVVDRKLRNTAEHVDDRVIRFEGGLIVSTFFEGDLFCSTRDDGSIGGIAVTRDTLEAVTAALDGIFWSQETIAAMQARRPRRL